jgi:hypothetical protein
MTSETNMRDAAFYRSMASSLSRYERNEPVPSDTDTGLAMVSIVTSLAAMCLHHVSGLRALLEALRGLEDEEDRQMGEP